MSDTPDEPRDNGAEVAESETPGAEGGIRNDASDVDDELA
jgi:hypothetical protein